MAVLGMNKTPPKMQNMIVNRKGMIHVLFRLQTASDIMFLVQDKVNGLSMINFANQTIIF